MTIAEFQAWLRGFTEGRKLTAGDASRIAEEAQKLQPIEYMPIEYAPYVPSPTFVPFERPFHPLYPQVPWTPWDRWTTLGPIVITTTSNSGTALALT